MKLALVDMDLVTKDPKLGLGYIASYLRKFGFDNVAIIDKEDPIKAVEREKPDLIGISCISAEYGLVKQFTEKVKTMGIPVVIGGPHISSLPHKLDKIFDIGVIGEGEQTMLEIVKTFEKYGLEKSKLKKIDGIVFHDKGVKRTNQRKLIDPLDEIPSPARDLMNMDYYLQPRQFIPSKIGIYTQMMTSRGCPYNCVFCYSKIFWRRTRFHSAEYVVNEIKLIVEKYNPDGIIIYDDLFIADKKRFENIVKLIKSEGIDVEFMIEARANLINDHICRLLKEMNVVHVTFGLETGSEKILKYLKKGTVTVKDNRRAIKLCKEHGMMTQGLLMMGTPNENEEDLKQTLSLVRDKNLDSFHVWQLTPFPNTEIWDYAESKGLVSDETDMSKLSLYYNPDLILTDKIPEEKFKEWYDKFQAEMKRKWFGTIPKFKLKDVLSPRFFLKMVANRERILKYLKHSVIK